MWQSDPLWAALAAMRIGPDAAASTFTARLAAENGWSPAHAEAVAHEYRRFLYLVAKAGEPLTPSDDVDQAWHLHLLHSRHYWEVLCAQILGRPLHHEPAAGGADDAERHRRQYEATLARYRTTFGDAPPPGIWPATGAHLPLKPLRIDAGRYWLVPRMSVGAAAPLAAAFLTAACSALAANHAAKGGGISWPSVLVVAGGILGLALLCKLLITGGGKGGGGGCSAGGCGGMGGGDSHGGGGHGCGGHGCGGGCGGH